MRVALLTSSRADYSIYRPLIAKLHADPFFKLSIVAFGTHSSEKFGTTFQEIINDGFTVSHLIEFNQPSDSPGDISRNMAYTMESFTKIWETESFDWLIALGDRYEMFAAVFSAIPFSIKVAHISGGEITLGAIDNVFRDSITAAATLHFASTDVYAKRIKQLKNTDQGIHNVGALSLDNLLQLQLLSIDDFENKFGIPLSAPTILITVHPETVDYQSNEVYIKEVQKALLQLDSHQLLITMPNADTFGHVIREHWHQLKKERDGVFLFENLGTIGYLSAMKWCSFMIGNTSSGFVEAAMFPKWVVNLGNRQKGRIETPNILTVPFSADKILEAVDRIRLANQPAPIRIYGDGQAASKIVHILKKMK